MIGSLLKRFTAHSSDLHHWKEMFPWLESVAGERVTASSAMGLAAFFACMRNIAEDVAKLPLDVVRKRGGQRMPVDHDIEYLLTVAPNDDMTAMDFRQTLTAHACAFGSGYAEIMRTPSGKIVAAI